MSKKRMETTMDFLGSLSNDDTPKQFLPVSSMMADPDQPRKNFDQEALDNLAAAISTDGILQPLLVRESGGEPPYIITDGERRWRAAKAAGLDEVPCFIRNDIDSQRLRLVQAIANVNREDLSDYELAVVIRQQLDENPRLKQKDMARQLGISPPTVTRLLAMLSPEYESLSREGLIENASALSHLKKLGDEERESLIQAAQEGQVITREVVEKSKAKEAAQAATETAQEPIQQDDDVPELPAQEEPKAPPKKKEAPASKSKALQGVQEAARKLCEATGLLDSFQINSKMPCGFFMDFPSLDSQLSRVSEETKLRSHVWKLLVSITGQLDSRTVSALPASDDSITYKFTQELMRDDETLRAAFEKHDVDHDESSCPYVRLDDLARIFTNTKVLTLTTELLSAITQFRSENSKQALQGFKSVFGSEW